MANPEASKPPGQDEAVHKDGAGSAPPPPFLEVTCRSSGVVRRFAAGTTARYALHAVNRKLAPGAPAALHVEAAKDGEEPVCFGPTAPLADYGRGWRLQTVTEQDAPGSHHQAPPPDHTKKGDGEAKGDVREREALMNKGTSAYLAKIGLAFVFMFLIGRAVHLLARDDPRHDPARIHSRILVVMKRSHVLLPMHLFILEKKQFFL